MTEKKETFKDVPMLESKYSVSNSGRVYSKINGFILKHYINPTNQIHQVKISDENAKPKTISVIRLMALAFIENPNPKLYNYAINKNGNQHDLTINNIMWGTSSIQNRRKNIRHPEVKEKFLKSSVNINTRKMTDALVEKMHLYRDMGYSVKQLSKILPIKKTQIFNLLKERD